MDLLMIIPLNSQKNLHPHHPWQVLHPTTSAPMTKAICQVHHPKTSAPMTNAIKMKRVTTMLHQKFGQPKNVDGLEINLVRFHNPNIEILPLDKNAGQIVQRGHPLAKNFLFDSIWDLLLLNVWFTMVPLPLSNNMALYPLMRFSKRWKLSWI